MKGRCLNRLTTGPKYRVVHRSTPRVGLEPTTLRLTAECSTIELSRHIFVVPSKPHTSYHTKPSNANLFAITIASIKRRPISSSQLRALLHFHLCPIYLVVFKGSRGISHLEGGFTLRCLQRLSLPDSATLLCTWQCNRYTGGPSIPVLSY